MMLEGESSVGRFYIGASSKKQLRVCAVVRTVDLECNQIDNESYSILISKTPTGAGDCFCYLKNNADKDIVISSIKIYAASDETITIKIGDTGTPVGGTDNIPVNRRAGSGNVADVDCETGVDITGLSGGNEVESVFVKGGESSVRYGWVSGIIIPKNHTFTIYTTTGAIAILSTISMHFCGCE